MASTRSWPRRCKPRCSTRRAGTWIPGRSPGRCWTGCWTGPGAARISIRSCTPAWRSSSPRPATDRDRAVGHAREAVGATPRLMSVSSTVAARDGLRAAVRGPGRRGPRWRLRPGCGWRRSAAGRCHPRWPRSVASLIALYCGEVSEAAAYGQQAMAEGTGEVWISSIAAAFLVLALIDRGAPAAARAVLPRAAYPAICCPTWPYVVVRHARGCLQAAAGEHTAAADDLLSGRRAGRALGHPQPGHDGLALGRGPVARPRSATRRRPGGCAPRRSRWPAAGAALARWGSRCARPAWSAAATAGSSCSPRR